jgi:hypothetical protein
MGLSAVLLQSVARGWRVRAAMHRGAWRKIVDPDGDVYWWSEHFEVASWEPPMLDEQFNYMAGQGIE